MTVTPTLARGEVCVDVGDTQCIAYLSMEAMRQVRELTGKGALRIVTDAAQERTESEAAAAAADGVEQLGAIVACAVHAGAKRHAGRDWADEVLDMTCDEIMEAVLMAGGIQGIAAAAMQIATPLFTGGDEGKGQKGPGKRKRAPKAS